MNWAALTLKLIVIAGGAWLGWRLGTLEQRVEQLAIFIGDHAGQHLEQLP